MALEPSSPAAAPAESAPLVPTSHPCSTPILDRPPELSSPGTIALAVDDMATREMPALGLPSIPGRLIVCETSATIGFPGDRMQLVIGRRDQFGKFKPDIDLTDHGGDEKGVSRQHALLSCRDNQVYIQDLGSSNGTYVNQQQLKPRQPHPLHDQDTIWLGHMKLTYKI